MGWEPLHALLKNIFPSSIQRKESIAIGALMSRVVCRAVPRAIQTVAEINPDYDVELWGRALPGQEASQWAVHCQGPVGEPAQPDEQRHL